MKPYRYKEAGLAQVARAFAPREQRPRRWPAIALFAVFLWIFCRGDSIRGFASAAPNPAARSNEMNLRMAGAVAALLVAGSTYAQDAVQWRVKDGGNGNWYVLDLENRLWSVAQSYAESIGGHLATITSASEQAAIVPLVSGLQADVWLGASRLGSQNVMLWVTGEPFSYAPWSAGHPNFEPDRVSLEMNCRPATGEFGLWGVEYPFAWGPGQASIIEWSADCNSDGIVDFGQIRAGELVDANANNIPDCCENGTVCGCPADIVQDGAVNGVDLAAVINAWGTNGGMLPRTDIDRNGIVDGGDLAQVLGAWGICP